MRRAALAASLALLAPAAASAHPGHGYPEVAVGSFAFAPQEVAITAGDFVIWRWKGPDVDHTVTADAGQSMQFSSDPDGTPSRRVGEGWSTSFPEPGRFTYHCSVHEFMTGAVVVAERQADPAPAAPQLSDVQVAGAEAAVVVRFRLSKAASVRVRVKRRAGGTVRERYFAGPPGANRRTIALKGVPDGRYDLVLTVLDSATGRVVATNTRSFRLG